MNQYFDSMPYAKEWVDIFEMNDYYGWIQIESVSSKYNYYIYEKTRTGLSSYKHDISRGSGTGPAYVSFEVCMKGTLNDDIDEDAMMRRIKNTKRLYPSLRVVISLPSMTDDEDSLEIELEDAFVMQN